MTNKTCPNLLSTSKTFKRIVWYDFNFKTFVKIKEKWLYENHYFYTNYKLSVCKIVNSTKSEGNFNFDKQTEKIQVLNNFVMQCDELISLGG